MIAPSVCRAPRVLLCILLAALGHAAGAEPRRPLLRDFIGLCVHTVQFKPEMYAPVARFVRDYHPLVWDTGQPMDFSTQLPMARNGVDWGGMYGEWVKSGYRVDACIQFDDIEPKAWSHAATDSFAYGKAFARCFGPGGKNLVECMEIGNEPGLYDDAAYKTIFDGMARGAREGDPRMRIATCAANLGPSGRYSKSVDCLKGLDSLYDVVSVHIYPELEGWPTWRRSYPEDPKLHFLEDIGHVLAWRKEHAPDKEVWLTEFGWDASTKPAPSSGDFAKWEGSTDLQQAQWIVRCFMILAATDLDRACLFFFNDSDEPHVHGSSGLTRDFHPKPSFYAMAHLQRTLGGFRFSKIVRQDANDGYVYEFINDARERIWAVWKPQAPERDVAVPIPGAAIVKSERMPLIPGAAESVKFAVAPGGNIELRATEIPVFLWLR